jgi:arylformamidase
MIYDVSVPIDNPMPVWPSDPPVKLMTEAHASRDQSYTIRVTRIEMGSHTGTHIDAPWHFIESGRRLNEIPLNTLVGEATVFEIAGVRSIGKSEVEKLQLNGIERILFKTDNSSHWTDTNFYTNFVYLEPAAAQVLADAGVRLVGIDYLSIDVFGSEKHPSHFVLLERNIVIVEGLNLSRIPAGNYRMIALPLNLQDVDGAPTRVILESLT